MRFYSLCVYNGDCKCLHFFIYIYTINSSHMKTIGIYLGKYMPSITTGEHHWDEDTVAKGMGGSETWAYEVGTRLANKGYDVTIYADPEYDHDPCPGFHLVTYQRYFYDVLRREYDYFIYSRYASVDTILPHLKCHNVYVMVHDICVVTPDHNTKQIGLGRIKKYCYLSDWHKEYLLSLYSDIGLTDSLLHKVSNGYSEQFYKDVDLNNKENSMIWSSSLARGFEDFYEYVFFPVFQKVPDFKLYVCTGTIAPKDYHLLKKAELLPGVEVLGKLSKEDLASYQKRSKVWVYPGQFPETFCITAVENANAGNVIISPLSYGLSTTLNDVQYLKDLNLGILNKENAHEYVDLTIKALTNDEERLKLANECINGCKTYSWDRAAQEIIDLLESPQPTEKDIYNYVISQINAK